MCTRYHLCTGEPVGCCGGSGKLEVERQLYSDLAGGICFVCMPFCRGDFQLCFLHHKMLRKLAVIIL